MTIRLARGLDLPDDAVTETFAILAIRGVGKTYTAKKFAEEILRAGYQAVIVDPVGVWWGLRSSADGSDAGLPIVVFGGDHADVPLEANAGFSPTSSTFRTYVSTLTRNGLADKTGDEISASATLFL